MNHTCKSHPSIWDVQTVYDTNDINRDIFIGMRFRREAPPFFSYSTQTITMPIAFPWLIVIVANCCEAPPFFASSMQTILMLMAFPRMSEIFA